MLGQSAVLLCRLAREPHGVGESQLPFTAPLSTS